MDANSCDMSTVFTSSILKMAKNGRRKRENENQTFYLNASMKSQSSGLN